MSTGLGWLGVGVGIIGCGATFLMAAAFTGSLGACGVGFDRSRGRLAAICAALFTLVFWALSMQHRAPYSPGQTLGWGFLIGGVTGILAILLSLRLSALAAETASIRSRRLAVLSHAFLGLCGVSLTYVLFQGDPGDALLGFSIGVVMAAIVHYYLQSPESRFASALIETSAAFPVTIAVAILFAVRHFGGTPLRTWWALPILIATTALIASYIGAEIGSLGRLREKPGKSYALTVLISAVLVIGLGAIYAWRAVGSWELLEVIAVGIGVAALIAWLAVAISVTGRGPNALEAACTSVVLVGAFSVLTFKLWAGLGMAIGLIAASAVFLPALAFLGDRQNADERAGGLGILPRTLQRALYLGLAVLLFRLFVQHYRSDLGTADIRIHYTFIGALLGLVLPFVLAASLLRLQGASRPGSALALAGVLITALFAAASPMLIFLLWDIKAVMGLSFGLTAAAAFSLLLQLPMDADAEAKTSPLTGGQSLMLLLIGAQLVAVQFAGPLSGLELTRSARISILAAAAASWLVWFVLSSVLSARRAA